jgi:hypothetical protein
MKSDHSPLNIVSFDEEFPNEAYCIRLNGEKKWEVYYPERGQKSNLKEFEKKLMISIKQLNLSSVHQFIKKQTTISSC